MLREVNVPEAVLRFETDRSLLDSTTILSTERLAKSGIFSDCRVILKSEDEDPAANAIHFNEFVLILAGFSKTAWRSRDACYRFKEINNAECAKLYGGMSCVSLKT